MSDKLAIAIIGSGVMAYAMSETAEKMGIEAHCFSSDSHAIVIGKCTEHHLVDIFDIERIVDVCEKQNIKGVLATTELTVQIAAIVSEKLGLNGMSVEIAKQITNKGYVRDKIQSECGILQPEYMVVRDKKYMGKSPINYPVIVKPTSLGGKRGILVARNEKEYCDAISYAYANMPQGRQEIIVEKYLEGGKEFSVESLSFNGRHKVIQVTEKIVSAPPHIVELGHIQPARITMDVRARIEESIPKLLAMAGIDNTSTHTEIKLIADKLYLIELNARPGGDNIAWKLTPLSTGFDYLGGAIKIACGSFDFGDVNNLDEKSSGLLYVTKQTEFLQNIFHDCKKYPWLYEKNMVSRDLVLLVNNNSWHTNYMIFQNEEGIPKEIIDSFMGPGITEGEKNE